jgi:3-oxoadipate enol-lactonase/4-carboxymuconolactone decarboxylase
MAVITEMALERFFSDAFRAAHPEIVAPIREGLLATSREGYAACAGAIRDMDLAPRLGAIAAPTLVITGTKDVSTPLAGHGDALVAGIPGARLATLEAAHLASLEAPEPMAAAIETFLSGLAVTDARETLFQAGLGNRRRVLGDAWVDRSLANRTPFNADFQAMITRIAWHEIWGRPGLDDRTRRLLVLAITAALGRWEEFRLHVKAGLERNGFTRDELKETLMQTAIYAGVPAANTAFAEAAEVIRAIDATHEPTS